jgi:uncharacterized protein YkwD
MRPLLLSRRGAVFRGILVASGASGCAAVQSRPGSAQPVRSDDDAPRSKEVHQVDPLKTAADLVAAHNQVRAEAKLPSLFVSKKLQAAAIEHARDMANHKKMSHTGSDGSTPSARIMARGYRMKRTGENIAFGQRRVEDVMKLWMKSPPHRRNILGNFSEIGAACATASDGTLYWCVSFGLPARPR